MLVFRNQRVEIDSFRSSPRTFEGGPISSLKRPRPFEMRDVLVLLVGDAMFLSSLDKMQCYLWSWDTFNPFGGEDLRWNLILIVFQSALSTLSASVVYVELLSNR